MLEVGRCDSRNLQKTNKQTNEKPNSFYGCFYFLSDAKIPHLRVRMKVRSVLRHFLSGKFKCVDISFFHELQ